MSPLSPAPAAADRLRRLAVAAAITASDVKEERTEERREEREGNSEKKKMSLLKIIFIF